MILINIFGMLLLMLPEQISTWSLTNDPELENLKKSQQRQSIEMIIKKTV